MLIVAYDGSVADPFAVRATGDRERRKGLGRPAGAAARGSEEDLRDTSCGSAVPFFPYVFTDPKLASELRQGIIAVAIDSRMEKKTLAGLKVGQLPTYIFRYADGVEYQRLEGDFFRPKYILYCLRELRKFEAERDHPLLKGE